jgi:hypothetical protein
MNDTPREVLVVFGQQASERTLNQLKKATSVTQVLLPRLVLIRAEPEIFKAIAHLDGVLGVYEKAPLEILNLTSAERVFIAAWETRGSQKQRAGDRLSWDSPGFVAPDPPNDDESKQ